MKRLVLLFLSLMFLLCACTPQTDSNPSVQSSEVSDSIEIQTSNENISNNSSIALEDVTTPVSEPDENIAAYIIYTNEACDLPAEHKEYFEILLSSDGWIDGTVDCENDFTIQFGEKTFYYHSECGTVSTAEEARSKNLNESERAKLNNIFSEMFASFIETPSESVENSESESESESEPEPKPEFVRGPGNPKQPTHKTPENLNCYNDSIKYHGTEITPIYIQMIDIDRFFVRRGDKGMISSSNTDDGHIEQAGLKLWICTESGKKIDYVYTNSDGIAKFECTPGVYNIYFEGDGTWASKYCGTIHASDIYNEYDRYRDYALFIYHDVYEDFKVRVIDSETKEPIKGAKVTVSDAVEYTDDEGYAVFKPLLYYVHGIGTAFTVDCRNEGYVRSNYNDADLYATYIEVEMETIKYYDFTITILDYDTKTPIKGVKVTNMPIATYMNNKVSGKDGTISGRTSSEAFKNNLYIYIEYTYEYTLEDGTTEKYTAYDTVIVTANRLDQTIYVEYSVRDHKFRDD